MNQPSPLPPGQPLEVMDLRSRARRVNQLTRRRLDSLLPLAMRKNGIDMWLILCQEDNPDPVFQTMIPFDTWAPILQILIFFDRGPTKRIERINLSGADTHDWFDRPYTGQSTDKQWTLLPEIVARRDPQKIGLNIGAVQWAAGGLTHNLYTQLAESLPDKYVQRFVSAESACTVWLESFLDDELDTYRGVIRLARALIAETFSPRSITPGHTRLDDLRWIYWQSLADRGLQTSFLPYFRRCRSPRNLAEFGENDPLIRPGDLLHCDVGIRYLRLHSDHQEWAYVLRPGETQAPAQLRDLLAQGNRLQDTFMAECRPGLTGNQILQNTLDAARRAGLPQPRVYSHSLGHLLHEPGPLIGLPWEQKNCPGRGDVELVPHSCFAMELSVSDRVPEWDHQEVRLSIEQDVAVTPDQGCHLLAGRQTDFHLI